MKKPTETRAALNLKRIQTESPSVERLRAALRRDDRGRWTSPFAASGAKPPPSAPPKRFA